MGMGWGEPVRQSAGIGGPRQALVPAGDWERGRPTGDGGSGEKVAKGAVRRVDPGTAVGGVGLDVRDGVGFPGVEARVRPGRGARQGELQGRREEPARSNSR